MSELAPVYQLPRRLPDPAGLIGPAAEYPPPFSRPVLGFRATCGFPSPADDFLGEDLDLNQRCIRNAVATYFVEADTGTSMIEFGIFPGDTLVVDRSLTARHGDIVMVLWEGGYMVKQWWLYRGQLELRSGNPAHAPIVVGQEAELEVWGVITWSFRKQFRR